MIDLDELKRLFTYDASTGKFCAIVSVKGRKFMPGHVLGTVSSSGHLKTVVNGRAIYLHRLAWLYSYGRWPNSQIDHINGDKKDNRIENLREANYSENGQNRFFARQDSATGVIGVQKHKASGLYLARITINRNLIKIGYFKTPEEAHSAYLEKKKELHPFSTLVNP